MMLRRDGKEFDAHFQHQVGPFRRIKAGRVKALHHLPVIREGEAVIEVAPLMPAKYGIQAPMRRQPDLSLDKD